MKNRQPVEGERVVVIIGWDDFLRIVGNDRQPDSTVNTNDPEGDHNA
jgi:hypothetical protein